MDTLFCIEDITNKIILGNSEIELKKIPDESIDCVIIDPPYRYLNHKLDRNFNREELFKNLYRILKNNSFLVIFGRGIVFIEDTICLKNNGFLFKEEFVFVKNRISSCVIDVPRQHELAFVFSKGKAKLNRLYVDTFEYLQNRDVSKMLDTFYLDYKNIYNALNNKENVEIIKNYIENGITTYRDLPRKNKHNISIRNNNFKKDYKFLSNLKKLQKGMVQSTVFNIKIEQRQYKVPTQKPIELISRILKIISKENDLVLDCFMGGGSTALACIKEGRRYVGIEIDKEYFDIANKRIEELKNNYMLAL